MSLLAPFAAALVGAGVGLALCGGAVGRWTGALAIAGGVVTELAQVSATWLADAVRAGKIRWVLTGSSGGAGGSGFGARVGDRTAMSAVERACTPVASVSDLYDCQGRADALAWLPGISQLRSP